MMSPTQVFQDGAFALSHRHARARTASSRRSRRCCSTSLEFGLNVQEAIEAPRIRVYRDRLVDAEARIPEDDARGARPARAPGQRPSTTGRGSWAAGRASRAIPESGALMAGADPRRDGYALAI